MSQMELLYTLLAALLFIGAILIGGLVHIVLLSRGWTIPAQDAKLTTLGRRTDEAVRVANSAADSARIAHDGIDYSFRALSEQLANVNMRLDDLLRVKETARIIEGRMDATEQELGWIKAQIDSLACSELAWHAREKPGFCPIHQKDCPLEIESKGGA